MKKKNVGHGCFKAASLNSSATAFQIALYPYGLMGVPK
jgi:hypothetical protein